MNLHKVKFNVQMTTPKGSITIPVEVEFSDAKDLGKKVEEAILDGYEKQINIPNYNNILQPRSDLCWVIIEYIDGTCEKTATTHEAYAEVSKALVEGKFQPEQMVPFSAAFTVRRDQIRSITKSNLPVYQ